MGKINSRSKGAEGEREFCRWLQDNLGLSFLPTRNLEQCRDSGADIMDVPPFIIEVKRCQTMAKRDWWLQVTKANEDWNRARVVAFRKNQQPWRILISAIYIGLKKGFIQLEEKEAIEWMQANINK